MYDTFVWGLLVASLVICFLLLLASSAKVGRSLSDLEYQKISGQNGVLKIRSWIDVRTHANRILLALAFIVIAGLLLVDAPIWIRTLVNRLLFVVIPLCFLVSSYLDWFDDGRQLEILARENLHPRTKVGEPS